MSVQAPPSRTDLLDDVAALDAESRFVETDEVRLHVLSYRGDGPPGLVLPGITSPAISWDFVARELCDVAELHVLDQRGRGLSGQPEHGYALRDLVADAVAVVRELGLDAPILLGHSLGARVAAAAAATTPGLARGLLLVDPPLSGPGRDPYPTSLDAFLDQLNEARLGTTAEEVRAYYPHWPEAELELRARWLATCGIAAVVEAHRGFEHDDFLPIWRSPLPLTALVYGGESPMVPLAGVRELEAVKPEAALIGIPGAGHMVPWDRPAAFIETVRRLLPQLARSLDD